MELDRNLIVIVVLIVALPIIAVLTAMVISLFLRMLVTLGRQQLRQLGDVRRDPPRLIEPR